MKKLLLALALVAIMALPAWAANTITYVEGSRVITFTSIDTDWTWTDTFPGKTSGLVILAIRFNPGAINDRCVINAGTVSGGDLFDSSVAQNTGEASIQYYDTSKRYKPVLDVSDGTYNAAAKITIILGE